MNHKLYVLFELRTYTDRLVKPFFTRALAEEELKRFNASNSKSQYEIREYSRSDK